MALEMLEYCCTAVYRIVYRQAKRCWFAHRCMQFSSLRAACQGLLTCKVMQSVMSTAPLQRIHLKSIELLYGMTEVIDTHWPIVTVAPELGT